MAMLEETRGSFSLRIHIEHKLTIESSSIVKKGRRKFTKAILSHIKQIEEMKRKKCEVN